MGTVKLQLARIASVCTDRVRYSLTLIHAIGDHSFPNCGAARQVLEKFVSLTVLFHRSLQLPGL